jgi:hypothetical protein
MCFAMKNHNLITDVLMLGVLGTISALAIAPKELLMPNSVQMALLVALLALLVSFMTVVWREDPADERELQNQSTASRYAYLVGICLLVIALVAQSLDHKVDPVVPITLFGMIATKITVQNHKNR